jgi:hypothetical protein
MRILHPWAIVLCVACSIQALAQEKLGGRPDRGGPIAATPPSGHTLVMNKKVQEELKFTADQVTDISDAIRKVRAKYLSDPDKVRTLEPKDKAELLAKVEKESLKAVGDILKPEQAKRLKQIDFQEQLRHKPRTLLQGDAAKDLQLTDKQKKRIALVLDQLDQDMGAALFAREMEEIPKLRKKAMDDIRSSLNDGQKKTLEALTGRPFELPGPDLTPGKPGTIPGEKQ